MLAHSEINSTMGRIQGNTVIIGHAYLLVGVLTKAHLSISRDFSRIFGQGDKLGFPKIKGGQLMYILGIDTPSCM